MGTWRGHGASVSVRADQEFEESRKVLNGRGKEIREIDQPMKAEALTEEEELLREKRYVLVMKIQECWIGLPSIHLDNSLGLEGDKSIVTFTMSTWNLWRIPHQELLSMMSGQKGLQRPDKVVAQKAFAVGDPKCPVALLEKMITKRPTSHNTSHSTYSLYANLSHPCGTVCNDLEPIK